MIESETVNSCKPQFQ